MIFQQLKIKVKQLISMQNTSVSVIYASLFCFFLTRECAHAHERVIAIVDFSLGRSVGWLVGWFGC